MPLPTDPSLPLQWHLINSAPDGLDLNVERVWNLVTGPAYTGAGVTVTVTNTAFDYVHPDLAGNYLTVQDYDFLNGDNDPFGGTTGTDGTAQLGLIGAADNTLHGVGVAYDTQLVGYGVLSLPASGMMTTWFNHADFVLGSASGFSDVLHFGNTLSDVATMQFT
jgi:kexin